MGGSRIADYTLSIHPFVYFLFFSSVCILASSQTATLSQDQTLGDGQELLSANGKFQLGFFRLGSSLNRYLGIWWGNDTANSDWVANRENPVAETSAPLVFTIQEDGNLAVVDGTGKKYWFTNVSTPSKTTIAVLEDSGNLVLREGNSSDSGNIIWRSFDHPTHALLPGMKLGLNLTTQEIQMLRSWKSTDDPAPGNFAFGIDSDARNQFFIYRRSIPFRRAVFWNGSVFDDTGRWSFGVPYKGVVNFSVTSNEDEVYFSFYSQSETDTLTMRPDGVLEYTEDRGASRSSTYWIGFGKSDLCSISGGCGQYSSCNVNSRPVCRCLPGFEPSSVNPGDGCRRKSSLDCRNDEGVLVLNGVEVPQFTGSIASSRDAEECRAAFLSMCPINKGYSFISNGTGCAIWQQDLQDIHEEENPDQNQLVKDIGIRVAASDLKQDRRQCDNCGSNIVPYPLSTDLNCGDPKYGAFFCNTSNGQLYFRTLNGSFVISSIDADARTFVIRQEGVDLCWARSKERSDIHLNSSQPFRVSNRNTVLLFNCSTQQNTALDCTDSSVCHGYMQEGGAPCYNLEKCCSSIVEDSPYKVGVLSSGCSAYASIVNLDPSSSVNDWWEGVEILWDALPGKKNWLPVIISTTATVVVLLLVTIVYYLWRKMIEKKMLEKEQRKDIDLPFYEIGSVLVATEKFSDSNKLGQGGFGPVYKYIAFFQMLMQVDAWKHVIEKKEMEYGNSLKNPSRSKLLNWEKRYDIILGIAKGLLYLHEDSRLRIIHRDLKTSNILLDVDMKPKISDFGMARIFGRNQTEENTNRVVGTYGYMPPEYALHGLFSMKSDVFSFGVILLEIISGKKNTIFYHNDQSFTLLGHAWRLWNEGKWTDLIDANLSEECNLHEVQKCIQIGLLCVQENAEDRPTMTAVVGMFISETTALPTPKQAAFITTRSVPYPNPSSISKNEVTISALEGG